MVGVLICVTTCSNKDLSSKARDTSERYIHQRPKMYPQHTARHLSCFKIWDSLSQNLTDEGQLVIAPDEANSVKQW